MTEQVNNQRTAAPRMGRNAAMRRPSEEPAMLNDKLERLWNQQADEYNQWCDLGDDEKIEFAASVEREMSFDYQTAALSPVRWNDGFGISPAPTFGKD